MSGWESPRSELNQTGQVVLAIVIVFVILCGLWQLMRTPGPGIDYYGNEPPMYSGN